MPTKRTKVQTFRIDAYCDKCGERMSPTGLTLTCYPPLYPHDCDGCGHRENLSRHFPCYVYEEDP